MVNVPYPGVRRELKQLSKDVKLIVARLEKAISNQSKLDKAMTAKTARKPKVKAKKKPTD